MSGAFDGALLAFALEQLAFAFDSRFKGFDFLLYDGAIAVIVDADALQNI